MQTFKQFLAEKTETVHGTTIFINPSQGTIKNKIAVFGGTRWFIDVEDNFYIWDADKLIHNSAMNGVGIEYDPFDLLRGEIHFTRKEKYVVDNAKFKSKPRSRSLRRYFSDTKFVVKKRSILGY